MDHVLFDSFVHLLRQVSSPVAVRRAEDDGNTADILREVDDSGFP